MARPTLEDVADPTTWQDDPAWSDGPDRHHPELLVEQGHRERKAHPERVDRAGPGKEERMLGLHPAAAAESAHPFARGRRHLDPPPPTARIPQNDVPHDAAR
jgi:hypothetical protein